MDSTLKSTAVLMSGRLTGVVVAFCIPVVLTRVLDQSAFGTYKQLFLIYATLYGIAQIGMAESLFYFLPANPARAGRFALNSLLALIGSGAACLAGLWLGRGRIAAWIGNDALAEGLPWIGLYLALMLASTGLEIVLISRKRFVGAAAIYAGSDVVRTALSLLPLLMTRSLEGVLIGGASFAAVRFATTCLLLRREFGADFRVDGALLKSQLAYAIPFELAVVFEILQANLHQYAVSLHFDAAAFAVYSVGCLQVPLVDLVAGTSCNVMMVKMGEDLKSGRPAEALAAWHGTVRKLAWVFFPMVVVLLVNARDLIVFLFTASYAASVPVFMVWTISFLLLALPVDGVLRVFADTRSLFLIGGTKLLIIGLAVGWFLARFHLLGGVLVTLLATLLGKTLALARVKHHMRVGLLGLLPWGGLAATLGCAVAAGLPALLVREHLGLPPLASIVVSGLVYAMVYAALAGGFRSAGLRRRLGALLEAQR